MSVAATIAATTTRHAAPDLCVSSLTICPSVASHAPPEASAVPVRGSSRTSVGCYFTKNVISSSIGGVNGFASLWTSSAFSVCCPGPTPSKT